jgi:hypothetical protein
MPISNQVKAGVKRNVTTELPIEVFLEFEAICKKAGLSKAQYMRKLVEGVVEARKAKENA